MASDKEFIEYVVNQIQDAGLITYRKMFGEYCIYCDGKVVSLVADNRFFVKETDVGRQYLGTYEEGEPYPGAKLWFLMDEQLDNEDLVTNLIRITADELPEPKPKKKGTGNR